MAYRYRIYKQLIPLDNNTADPAWAKRQVWVQKLNNEDTVNEFTTLTAARNERDGLAAADPTGRVYKIVKVDLNGVEPDLDVQ